MQPKTASSQVVPKGYGAVQFERDHVFKSGCRVLDAWAVPEVDLTLFLDCPCNDAGPGTQAEDEKKAFEGRQPTSDGVVCGFEIVSERRYK